jgi:hypothetical protein
MSLTQGILDTQACTQTWNTTADKIIVSGTGVLTEVGCINTLPVLQNSASSIVLIENSQWNTARASTYLIESSAGQLSIANSIVANTSATDGGGIYIHNSQSASAPNAVANCVVGAINTVNIASGVTLYSKVATTGSVVLTSAVGVPDVSGNILTNQSAASLGAEWLSNTWSLGTGWAGTFAAGFTHTAGNTATLTEATTYTLGGLYTVAWAITGRTTGSVTIAVGGISQGSVTATGSIGPKFTATTGIVVTPTTDFNGTITLSVKKIISQPATTTWLDAAGSTALEIRSVDASRLATAIGQNAGQNNTTGNYWASIGNNAGRINTTGNSWLAIGNSAGYNNTTGNYWTAIGNGAGYNNTTGNSWLAIGKNAGMYQLGSSWLAIDGYGDRGSTANELANTPIIGALAATAAAQTLSLNAVTTIYNANEQQSTLSTSQTLSATCTGNQLISTGSLSIALPTGVAAGFEVKFLSHYAFTLTYGSAVIYYGSTTGAASVSIPATNAITLAVFDGTSWNVR